MKQNINAPKPQFSSSETEQNIGGFQITVNKSPAVHFLYTRQKLISVERNLEFHDVSGAKLDQAGVVSETVDDIGTSSELIQDSPPSTLSDLEDSSFEDFTANTGGLVDEDEESRPRNTVS
nr:hypothetical protein Iba_chr01aCG8380 [Ipomoea batatas]